MDIRKKKRDNIIAAVFLILFLSAAFLITSKYISGVSEASCFNTLHQATKQLADEIYRNVNADRKILSAASRMIAELDEPDYEKTAHILSSFKDSNLLSRMELLLPDDTVLSADGTLTDASGILSFEEEAAKGIHLSRRDTDPADSEKMILRSFYPVKNSGSTIAVLYGVIELDSLPSVFSVDAFGGNAQLFIFEYDTGSYLLDTWHKSLGNTHSYYDRAIKYGYSRDTIVNGLYSGGKGQAAFRSETSGEYFYLDFFPVNINDWVVMISVPESVALADFYRIRMTLYILAGLEAVFLTSYFIWILMRLWRDANERQNQLNRIQYMLSIGETLFGAPADPSLFNTALQKVGSALEAEYAFFVTNKNAASKQAFIWSIHKEVNEARNTIYEYGFPYLCSLMKKHGAVISYRPDELFQDAPDEYALLKPYSIDSLMLIPVKNTDNVMTGTLGVANMKHHLKTAELLDCVMLYFSMAMNSLDSFRTIREMGMMDHLTGMLNRNSFQKSLEMHEKSPDSSLACIYVDADGLHEINNNLGHISGDRLLRTVASAIQEAFGSQDSYRIGGDEFLIFCTRLDETELSRRLTEMEKNIMESGYHISTGVEYRKNVPLVYQMVKNAEEKMYEAKRNYYKNKDEQKQVREMNRQLEKILQEKKDLDTFRSVLSYKYLGVYIVNLSVDTMRYIYIPPYFEKIMEASGGKFSRAIEIYANEQVHAEDRDTFLAFLEYERLENLLSQGIEPSLQYRRADDTSLLLRIYSSPDYTPQTRECIWSFEKSTDNESA